MRGGRVGEEAPTIRSVRRVEVEPRERSSSQSDFFLGGFLQTLPPSGKALWVPPPSPNASRSRRDSESLAESLPAEDSRYRLALHDGEGRELQSVPVRLWSVCVEPNPLDAGPTLYNFGAELLASPNSRRVVLMEGGRELDSVDASSTPPTLVRALPRPGVYDRAALEIAWHVHDPDPGATVRVDVLGDIGHAVGFEARGKRVWRYLRPKGTFEMVATDGFWTTRVTRTFAFLPGGRVRIE